MYAVSPRLNLFVFAGFLAATALLFGGNFPLAQGLMPIFCALLFIAGTFLPRQGYVKTAHNWVPYGVFLPLIIILGWSLLQVIPLGSASRLANPFWSIAPSPATWPAISINPLATIAYLPYAAGLLMAAVALYYSGQRHAFSFLKAITIIITAACLYGIIVFALGNQTVLWLQKTSYLHSLSGTFINRNSFATFAGLGMLASFALLLQRVGEISSRLEPLQRLRAFWLLVLRPSWPWALATIICFVALVLTSSRAGIASSVCGFIVLIGSIAYVREPVRPPLLAILGLSLILTIIVLSAIGQNLGDRLTNVGEDANIRQGIFIATSNLAKTLPFTGSGLGTYETAFHSVRSPEVIAGLLNATVEHAHNTYLELTSELGYPAMVLLALSVFSLIASYITGLATRRRAVIWPALGLATLTLVGGHALADFSLSIPAVALTTIAMLMLAFAQCFPLAETPAQPQSLRKILPMATVGVLVAGIAMWQTAANYHAFMAQKTVRSLVAAEPIGPGPMFLAQRHLMQCLGINPYHPTCLEGLAQINLSLATGYGLTGEKSGVGLVYLHMAQTYYQAALSQNPANPLSWYRLSRIEAFTGDKPAAVTHLANCILTGPGEPLLATQRVPYILSLLPGADADNTKLFVGNVLAIWSADPWGTATAILANPAIQPEFARVLVNTPDGPARWARFIKIPFPKL